MAFRLAVAVVHLPPLREREGDVGLLIETLLDQVNAESAEEPGYKQKKISPSAKNIMLRHSWPGNVRELLNTIRRAAIWSSHTTIGEADVRDAILGNLISSSKSDGILGRPISQGIDLQTILEDVARHYLSAALKHANGNKTRAAELVVLVGQKKAVGMAVKGKVETRRWSKLAEWMA